MTGFGRPSPKGPDTDAPIHLDGRLRYQGIAVPSVRMCYTAGLGVPQFLQ